MAACAASMCRHVAAVGPGVRLTELLWDLPHGLLQQATGARELLSGTVCADGFGVGWYDLDSRPEPARYANPAPIWSDANLPSFGPVVRSRLVVGAVRNATVPGQNTVANCAPFASGRHLFSLNGHLEGFDARWKDGALREWTSPARRALVRGTTDAEHLFQAFLSLLDAHAEREGAREATGPRAGAALANAVQELCRNVLAHAREARLAAQLNLLVADGHRVVATRAGASPTQNSLYLLQDGEEFPGSVVVASEPLYDDPSWEAVPPDTLLVLEPGAPPVRLKV